MQTNANRNKNGPALFGLCSFFPFLLDNEFCVILIFDFATQKYAFRAKWTQSHQIGFLQIVFVNCISVFFVCRIYIFSFTKTYAFFEFFLQSEMFWTRIYCYVMWNVRRCLCTTKRARFFCSQTGHYDRITTRAMRHFFVLLHRNLFRFACSMSTASIVV